MSLSRPPRRQRKLINFSSSVFSQQYELLGFVENNFIPTEDNFSDGDSCNTRHCVNDATLQVRLKAKSSWMRYTGRLCEQCAESIFGWMRFQLHKRVMIKTTEDRLSQQIDYPEAHEWFVRHMEWVN